MLYKLRQVMKSTEKELLQLVQGSAKMAFFMPDVIKILNIINQKHNFSKPYWIYHHNNSGNGFLIACFSWNRGITHEFSWKSSYVLIT